MAGGLVHAQRSMLAARRVLFVSVSYRPEHAGIGPYSAATAERLAAEGAEVNAVTGLPHYPSWRVSHDDRRRMRRRERLGGVLVTRLRQFVPRRQTALSRGAYELSFLLHGLLTPTVWRRADIVVAVIPAVSGGVLAALAATRHRVPLVLIVQDLSGVGARQSGILGGRWASSAVSAVERAIFRRATAIGTVHESLAEASRSLGVDPGKISTVPNWSLHRPVAVETRPAALDDVEGRFVVLHAGNMGLKQGLEVVVGAARLAQEQGRDDLLFLLVGDGNRRESLEAMAHGITTVRFLDPVEDDSFPGLLAAADLGLVTQRAEVQDMSVPSKLTAYFNAGLAVVSAVAEDCGTAREVRRSGGGVVVEPQDAGALLRAVVSLRAAPDLVRDLESAGRSYAGKHLSAEDGLLRITELIASQLPGHGTDPAGLRLP